MTNLEQLTFSTEHAAREWHRAFEWHLDVVPPLIEVIVWMTFPSIPVSRGGSRFDKIQISGGGYFDNIPDEIPGDAAAQDAKDLWWWLVEYTRAVAEWIIPDRPAPALDDKPNPDPLSARSVALTTIGWLIDHADRVRDVAELDEHMNEMFTEIRHLRGRYGVFPRPRRQLDLCRTCGARQVVFGWVSNPNGSPKPIRVGKCRTCGETYEVQHDPAPAPTPQVVLSSVCADGRHEACESVHCQCPCGHRSGVGREVGQS
ncbi:hypothetical protein [Microbacterium sp. 2FI]|uniref:hypothetical protein n=1 Tax=Microbacterium sp. 2FI TaxID=2502193 RepID=UPI0010F855E8|nr:hypothetical protein [Microbacterium sp. 2FI]